MRGVLGRVLVSAPARARVCARMCAYTLCLSGAGYSVIPVAFVPPSTPRAGRSLETKAGFLCLTRAGDARTAVHTSPRPPRGPTLRQAWGSPCVSVIAKTRLAGGPPSLIYWAPGLPRARRSHVGVSVYDWHPMYIIGTCRVVWAWACVRVRARLLVAPLHVPARTRRSQRRWRRKRWRRWSPCRGRR